MKINILLFAALFIALSSCFGSSKEPKRKLSKKELFGEWEGRTYSNPLFNFALEMPETWTYDSTYFQTGFGGDIIVGSNDFDEELPGLISCQFNLDKLNPFDRSPSAAKELQENADGTKMVFGAENVMVEPMTKMNIAGREYVSQKMAVNDGEETTYLTQFVSITEGYALSITFNFPNDLGEEKVMDLINSIKRLK